MFDEELHMFCQVLHMFCQVLHMFCQVLHKFGSCLDKFWHLNLFRLATTVFDMFFMILGEQLQQKVEIESKIRFFWRRCKPKCQWNGFQATQHGEVFSVTRFFFYPKSANFFKKISGFGLVIIKLYKGSCQY